MGRDNIIEKVEQLLALSANNPNENEAKAAAGKAQELIAKYRISAYELSPDAESPGESDVKKEISDIRKRFSRWVKFLYFVIASHNNCKTFGLLNTPYDGYRTQLIIGTETDIALTIQLVNYIKIQILRLSNKALERKKEIDEPIKRQFCYADDLKEMGVGDYLGFRGSYAMGMIDGIDTILKAANLSVSNEKGLVPISRALAFWENDWQKIIDSFIENNWGKLDKKKMPIHNARAAQKGFNDAQKVDLGLQSEIANDTEAPIMLNEGSE